MTSFASVMKNELMRLMKCFGIFSAFQSEINGCVKSFEKVML